MDKQNTLAVNRYKMEQKQRM